jgi:hypothetical protein
VNEREQVQRRAPAADRDPAAVGVPVAVKGTEARVLALQRSAGNAAVVARLREGRPSLPADPVPAAPGVVQRGFFSRVGKWLKGLFKPKTGGPVDTGGGAEEQKPLPPMEDMTDGGTPETTDGGTGETTEGGTPGPTDGGTAEETDGGTPGPTDGGTPGGVGEKEQAPDPSKAGPIAPETTKALPEHPPKPQLAMDLASGEAVLKNAFGSLKTIVPGKIEILDPDAFKAAYDKIYGAGNYSWDKYVKPKYGSLNGFAYDGTNYINKASAGLHTVVHEMLHNNTAGDWTPFVGSRWNEATTEVLTQEACAKLGVDAPVCYPGESPVVREAIASGLPLANLEEAYLKGGAKEKVGDWVDANCKENWAAVKGYMEANNWAAAKAALAKK